AVDAIGEPALDRRLVLEGGAWRADALGERDADARRLDVRREPLRKLAAERSLHPPRQREDERRQHGPDGDHGDASPARDAREELSPPRRHLHQRRGAPRAATVAATRRKSAASRPSSTSASVASALAAAARSPEPRAARARPAAASARAGPSGATASARRYVSAASDQALSASAAPPAARSASVGTSSSVGSGSSRALARAAPSGRGRRARAISARSSRSDPSAAIVAAASTFPAR